MASVGAHIAAGSLSASQLTDTFNKAIDYSYYNAISLLSIAVLCEVCTQGGYKNSFHWAGYCIALGGFIFQTSLFLYTLAGMKSLTALTPYGGILMISGWLALGVFAIFAKKVDFH